MKNFDLFKTFLVTTLAAFALVISSCDSLDGDLMMDYPQPSTTVTYTVTFNSNGGLWVDAQQIDANDTAMVPTTYWIGYDLVGWYTDAEFTTPFDITTTPITEDIMLYACWEVSQTVYYYVTYMNGSDVYTTVPTEEQTAAVQPEDPTGGAFIGWFEDETLLVPYDFSTIVTEDVTLYAKVWANDKTDFEISTVSEFLAFRDIVNTAATGSFTVKLMDDIDMTDVSSDWMPIGRYASTNSSVAAYFSGTFDGNGKTISNFTYDASSSTGNNYLGLFGVSGGTTVFKDLTIKNANISLAHSACAILVGAVVGGSELTISNCTIDGGSFAGANQIGSFVGSALASSYVTIENCTSSAAISTTGQYAGGLFGRSLSYAVITNSSFTGTATAGTNFAGGLVGISHTNGTLTVKNCFNTGSVSGAGTYVGGLVGSAQVAADIAGSYNTGNVVTTGAGPAGGIIGGDTVGATITSCYSAAGTVSCTGTIGGIAGTSAGTFTSNYFLAGAATNGIGNTSSDDGAAPVADLNSVVDAMNASMPADCAYEYVAGATSPTLQAK